MFPLNLQQQHEQLIDSPITAECFFTIVIPVRDEAEYLHKTLDSLVGQVDFRNQPIDCRQFEIIFLVNNSSDDSAEIIRSRQNREQFPVIHLAEKNIIPEQSNIGFIRRWLMNEAYLRLTGNRSGDGIIATTDGDSEIAPNWVTATIAEIKKGADAVGGRILINPAELEKMNVRTRAFHLRDTGYRLMAAEIEARLDYLAYDALPRHHQHFNGSFAVTTHAFERAGGVPEVRFLEDVAFYHALFRTDAHFRHSPAIRVQTSARTIGRTEAGLSTQINEWTVIGEKGDDYLVESASAIKRRLQARKNLRDLWNDSERRRGVSKDEIKYLADNLLISAEFLENRLNAAHTFGILYEEILHEQNLVGEWHRENPLVSIERAIFDLRLMLEQARREQFNFNQDFSQTSSRYFSVRV